MICNRRQHKVRGTSGLDSHSMEAHADTHTVLTVSDSVALKQ